MKTILAVIVTLALILPIKAVQAQSEVQVDPLTGGAQLSLPLWSIRSGNLSAPIGLSYTAGAGMKLNSSPNTAGMNWTHYAGGMVRREVRGLPDDYVGTSSGQVGDNRKGWLHGTIAKQVNNFTPSADANLATCNDENGDYQALLSFGYTQDTEPDIFTFSAPGLHGQFVFNKNKVIQVMPYHDLKINTLRGADSLIHQIEITNNVGVKYTFNVGDKTYRKSQVYASPANLPYLTSLYHYYVLPANFYSSWQLSNITSPTGSVLTFSYSSSYGKSSTPYEIISSGTDEVETVFFTEESTMGHVIQSITGANEIASFAWNGDQLSSIEIQELTYMQKKKFNLVYSYLKKPGETGPFKPKIPFLSSVAEEVNCSAYPGYQFEYHGIDLASTLPIEIPLGESTKQDFFGYYNGTATSRVPEIYVTTGDTGSDGERYRIDPAPGYSLLEAGGDRSINPTKVFYGTISRVTKPSGAYTLIEYEPNNFYDAIINGNSFGAGVRVKSLTLSDVNPSSSITVKYKYTQAGSALSSGKWIAKPIFAFANGVDITRLPENLAQDAIVLYSRVEVSTSGRGKSVYEFQLPGMYPETSNLDFEATKTKIARIYEAGYPCTALGNIRPGFHTYPFPVNTNYDFERGLTVQVTDFARDGRKVSEKVNSYQRTTLPIEPVYGVRFENFENIFLYGKYKILSRVNKYLLAEISRLYDQASPTKYNENQVSYTFNANQMLSVVTSTASDGVSNTKQYTYAKDYATTGTDTQSQMINQLVSSDQHGTVVETVSKKGTEVIHAELTLFDNVYGGGRILPKQKMMLGDVTGFAPSAVVGANFTYSNKYYPALIFDSYNGLGIPIGFRDQGRVSHSVFVGHNGTLPVANFVNAQLDHVIYSDFETGVELSSTGTVTSTTTDKWAGKKSVSMSTGSTLSKSVVRKGAEKFYRFSCWIKAATAATLSLQVNSQTAIALAYPSEAIGKWYYLEKRIDVSSVSSETSFTFKASVNTAIMLDNFSFYPESADITASSYEPFSGKSATLGSRGNASFIEYDNMGRAHFQLDQDKNLVSVTDYQYRTEAATLPVSHFTYTPENAAIYTGTSVTFTVSQSCLAGVTYQWFVDDVSQGITATSFAFMFTENKEYSIKLVASSTNGTSTSEVIIQPIPQASATLSLAAGESLVVNCQDSGFRNFTANLDGCYNLSNATFKWSYQYTGSSPVEVATTTVPTYEFQIPSGASFVVICQITTYCWNEKTRKYDEVITTATKNFTWQVLSQC